MFLHQDLLHISTKEAFLRMKSVLFVPESFYFCIAEHPDLTCPFWIVVTFCLLAAVAKWNGAVLEVVRFVFRLLLVLYLYIVCFPVAIGVFYQRVRGQRVAFVKRDTLLMICCLGYSFLFGCLFCMLMLAALAVGIVEEVQGILLMVFLWQMCAFLWKTVGMLSFSTFPVVDADANVKLAIATIGGGVALTVAFVNAVF